MRDTENTEDTVQKILQAVSSVSQTAFGPQPAEFSSTVFRTVWVNHISRPKRRK